MNHLLTLPTERDTSIEDEAKEQRLAEAAARLRYNSPEIASERLFADERIVTAIQQVIANGGCLELLELIDDISQELVMEGVE